MTLDEANRIVGAYGGFLECLNERLSSVLLGSLPEAILPYPSKMIEDALNVVAEDWHNKGDMGKVNLHHEVMAYLIAFKKDEEAFEAIQKLFSDPTYIEFVLKALNEFRSRPSQINWVSTFFKEVPLESVNFDNLTISTAYPVIRAYSTYLKNAHMQLSFLFSQQIPEAFLPFPKDKLKKALEFYASTYEAIGHEENQAVYTSGKIIMEEDYVSNEEAIKGFQETLVDDEARALIITDLKDYQVEAAKRASISVVQ